METAGRARTRDGTPAHDQAPVRVHVPDVVAYGGPGAAGTGWALPLAGRRIRISRGAGRMHVHVQYSFLPVVASQVFFALAYTRLDPSDLRARTRGRRVGVEWYRYLPSLDIGVLLLFV